MIKLIFITLFLFPALAYAEEILLDPISSGWDIAFTLYLLGGSLLVGGLTYALKKLSDLLGVKIENETVSGVLQRLTASISDAVSMVDQTLRKELMAAKDPNSEGGATITAKEKAQMFEAVWQALKDEYGGFSGIFKLAKKIGIGDVVSAKTKINTMIEAAVSTHKMRKKMADPT